jgi:uncharacterized membrane protein YccC
MNACTICTHSSLHSITADLMARVPYRTIEKRYDLSRSAIDRHVTRHITKAFQQLAAAGRNSADAAIVAEPVLQQMRTLHAKTWRILNEVENTKDYDKALNAIRECRRNLETIARLTGELDPRSPGENSGTINVVVQYVERQNVAVEMPRTEVSSPATAPAALPAGNGGQECQR